MNREYHKWYSQRLGREMELLIFGHAGVPALVFPTSGGRFFESEDRGMVAALSAKIDRGDLQLFCVDAVDNESWYNRSLPARWRIARHMQYEDYLLNEVVPLVRSKNQDSRLTTVGASFGGYHAVNLALRHPVLFTGFLSMSGAYDIAYFLRGYFDQNLYFNQPTQYLPKLTDSRVLDQMRRNRYVMATGLDDKCLDQNKKLAWILGEKGIPHKLYIWDAQNSHDWPTWKSMVQMYL